MKNLIKFEGVLDNLKTADLDRAVNRLLNYFGVEPAVEKEISLHQLPKVEALKEIKGGQFKILITYNPDRLDIDYSFNRSHISESLRKNCQLYVKSQIIRETFRIDSPREALVILDGKKYTQNENSGSYLFDPFFNILKFEIKRKDGKLHTESFKVVEAQELTFRYS